MLSFRQALILGVLQGISELFPISSLGHSIILPALLGWTIDQDANYFLTFLVTTHFATAAVRPECVVIEAFTKPTGITPPFPTMRQILLNLKLSLSKLTDCSAVASA